VSPKSAYFLLLSPRFLTRDPLVLPSFSPPFPPGKEKHKPTTTFPGLSALGGSWVSVTLRFVPLLKGPSPDLLVQSISLRL